MAETSSSVPLDNVRAQGHTDDVRQQRSAPHQQGPNQTLPGYAVGGTCSVRSKTVNKIANRLRRKITTRRAMPSIWFDIAIASNMAVPFSLWTGNHYMRLIAALIEVIVVAWYMLGWVPVRKPIRRIHTASTRTRRAPARRKAS